MMPETATLPQLSFKAQPLALFSTPVLHGTVPEADQLNAQLAGAVQSQMQKADGIARSNVGGWHSDTDMLKWGGEAAARLADLAIRAAKRISHFDGHSPEHLGWSTRMWANVTPNGGLNMSHAHPGVLWACVYYVDAGFADGEENSGGELFLEDPRFPVPFLTFPGFRAMGPDGKPQNREEQIKPRAGDLVMFPGYMRHGVRPHGGSRDRISIAMNIYVKSI